MEKSQGTAGSEPCSIWPQRQQPEVDLGEARVWRSCGIGGRRKQTEATDPYAFRRDGGARERATSGRRPIARGSNPSGAEGARLRLKAGKEFYLGALTLASEGLGAMQSTA